MFSFHKPKVYRSSTGCCICRAKSSSSRFTDSKKYEDDFMDCFQLHERRSGEICNACVLLVKRWKKLPAGSERNWRHVVDARAGPGTKSLTKFKSKNKKKLKLKPESMQKVEKFIKKKHIYMKNDRSGREESPGAVSDEITGEDFMSDMSGMSMPSSLAPSPTPSDDSAALPSVKHRNKSVSPHHSEKGTKRRLSTPAISSFLDMTFWKREKVCCGIIFKGPYGAVIVDPRFLKPCRGCKNQQQEKAALMSSGMGNSSGDSTASGRENRSSDMKGIKLAKSYSDSSSDSGYDESSNQGVGEGGHHRSNATGRKSVGQEEATAASNPLAEFAMHAASRCQQEVGEQPN
ncbi:Protein FAM60A [Cryptotermes secundus]|uniref:Protein FAM60A n=2 Tax=Cryptotermes secundus TaxID=105785 RepID=A0A2J7QEJ7_9NEOP|nr:SIN3-HDAC complex-associated factor isoform X3 [Cryptotermes secundus]PNF26997.1 Protein FAM60A [Cryptotermes secundus]